MSVWFLVHLEGPLGGQELLFPDRINEEEFLISFLFSVNRGYQIINHICSQVWSIKLWVEYI